VVNPPQVRLGEVGAGNGLGDGSLILIPDDFLLMTFLAFLEAGGVAATLHLSTRVLEDPVLGPFDDAPANSALGVWAEIGIVRIGVSLSKLRIGAMKLSKACDQRYKISI
jgi:hypothetical protein